MSEPTTIGIVGLGLMGRSIAANLLWKGLRVVAYTEPADGFAAARASIAADLDDLIAHDAAPAALRDEWPTRYEEAASIDGFACCDFVIESVFEALDAKRAVFDRLERVLPAGVTIGTNTSAIPITVLQEGRGSPERIVGMHWCPPCHLNRFLEVIRGERTGDAAVEAAMRLGERTGKEPALVRRDVEGFIVNRLQYAVYREALSLMERGIANAEMIDRVWRGVPGLWGGAMGPMRWMDLTGLAPYAAGMARINPTLSGEAGVPRVMQELIDRGARGMSNGRGFYVYTPEESAEWQRRWEAHCWDRAGEETT